MKKIVILDQTVYAVEGGELKKLGLADKLEHITGDVFKSSNETVVIKGNKISVLAKDTYPMPVVNDVLTDMPQEIRDLRDNHRTLVAYKGRTGQLGKLVEKYFGILAEFSQKDFENLVKNAVVTPAQNAVKLFIRDENGNYTEEKNITTISFDKKPAFIYRGGLYVKNAALKFARIEFKPLMISSEYIIFWGGGRNIFAMSMDEIGNISFKPLGKFDALIKTDFNQLIRIGDEYDGYTLYHLGRNIERVVSFDTLEDCRINLKDGTVTHDYNFTMEGVDYPQTSTYRFINGSYKREI